MSNILAIAVSGMQAATRRLEVSARNVANAQSNGALPDAQGNVPEGAPHAYVAERVDQVDLPGGGTATTESPVSPPYKSIYEPSAPYANAQGMVASPNVDLTDEVVQQVIARYNFAANAQVVKTYDRMMKSLLDIKV